MSMTKRQLSQQIASYGDDDVVLIEHNNQQWELSQVHAAGQPRDTGAKGGEATSPQGQGRMIALQAGPQYRPTSNTSASQTGSTSQK